MSQEMVWVEHMGGSLLSCLAYTTAAEVGEDGGLNPLGAGTRSPGDNY